MKSQLQTTTIPFESEVPESGRLKVPSKGLPSGPAAIEGVINHFPFRAQLEGDYMQLSSAILEAAGVESGSKVTVEITRVGEEEEVRVPVDLAQALKAHPEALDQWRDTTVKARRDWILWLLTAKQSKTRKTRIMKACDMLGSGKGRVCCFGGLNWLIKDHPISRDDTWQL